MKILNFGSCNIDFVYSLDHICKPGETIGADALARFPGGKGLNQSIAIARSGEKVFHAASIGEDGLFLREVLEESGVDVRYLRVTDTPSGQAIIQVDSKGENCIILFHGANYTNDPEFMDGVLADFEAGDILVLQNEITHLRHLIDKGSEKGMRLIFNPSPFDASLKDIDLNKISVLILNEIEGCDFTGFDDPEKICAYFTEKYPNLGVMLTLGSKGCMYADKNGVRRCPSFRVPVVDTTSAGDTFTGYFISGLIRELPIEQTLRLASAASALAVSREGASSSIPVRAEAEEALERFMCNS